MEYELASIESAPIPIIETTCNLVFKEGQNELNLQVFPGLHLNLQVLMTKLCERMAKKFK